MLSRKEMQDLMSDVTGKASQKRPAASKVKGPKSSETLGEAKTPDLPAVGKSFSKEAFLTRCMAKALCDGEINEWTLERSKHIKHVQAMLEKFGIQSSNRAGNETCVLFVEPFKAQMRYVEQGGDINMEAVRKHFPTMVEEDVTNKRVDLTALEINLKNVPNLSLKEAEEVKAAIALIAKVAKALGNSEVYQETNNDTVKDDFLIMLNEGKIDAKIRAEIMGTSVKVLDPKSLRIESLVSTKHGRCETCGYEKKASEAKDKNFVCPSCGHK